MATPRPPQGRTPKPSWFRIWLTAARPHTLTASLSPCLVSYACTHAPYAWTWTAFCLCIQLGTNLHNDYADYEKGADDPAKRVGPPRATAQGWLTPEQTCAAATVCLATATLIGIYLAIVFEQTTSVVYWFLIGTSVFNAFAYTGGQYPLGDLGLGSDWSIAYSGLGDIFVFLYFGLGATGTIPLVLHWSGSAPVDGVAVVMAGVQMGLLGVNIIVVNNLRDRLTDVHVGKRTWAVRFGRRFCEIEYVFCNLVAFGLVVVDAVVFRQKPVRLLPLLAAIPAWRETKAVMRKEGSQLNPHVGGAAKVQFLFAILYWIARTLS